MNAHSQDPEPDDGSEIDRRLSLLESRFDAVIPTLAKKSDIEDLRGDYERFRGDMRVDFEKFSGELRLEFTQFRGEMRADFDEFSGQMRAEFEVFRGQMRTEFETFRGQMRTEFETFRGQMVAESKQFRGDMLAEFQNFRGDTHVKIEGLRSELHKWVIGLFITALLGIFGAQTMMFNVLKNMFEDRTPAVPAAAPTNGGLPVASQALVKLSAQQQR